MKKYLFICHSNLNRSPFAEVWLRDYCQKNSLEAEVQSAGLQKVTAPDYMIDLFASTDRKPICVTSDILESANEIFPMEHYMALTIIEQYPKLRSIEGKIKVLDIPDLFHSSFLDIGVPDDLSPEEAVRIFDARYRYHRFGPKLFSKVLEGRLKPLLNK
jgi:protein-tyrosine-phosphatase